VIPTAPSLRALWRRVLAAGAVLTLAVSLLIGMTETASAASTRTWTFSGVTFDDGGQMTGSFDLSDTGQVSAVHITTSGGDTSTFGSSTTYDASNVEYAQYDGEWVYISTSDQDHYLEFRPPGLSNAADGDEVPLDTERSLEAVDRWAAIRRPAGSVVAGPATVPPAVTGTPTITSADAGAPRVGETMTGDDSAVTATPQGATKSYQWLRDGAVIPGATDTTYTLTNDDAGHSIAFQVGATEAGYPDASPVTSDTVGPVTGPARRLAVTARAGLHLAGRGILVTTVGLEANESYAITIDGIQVATGRANGTAALSRTVTVPASAGERPAPVTVTGSQPDRTGTTTIRVVVRKTLGLHLAKRVMHKSHRQWVTVRDLAAGEHVRVAYRGKRISPANAHANANGVYRVVIHVGRLAGTKTVTATGAFYGRRATTTFLVTRH
jgi:hypothetical protein